MTDWNEKEQEWFPGACYCVCHSRFSSRAACEHCKGDNSVTRYHQLRAKIFDALEAIDPQKVSLAWGDWLDVASHVANALTDEEEQVSDDKLPPAPPAVPPLERKS